MKQFFGLSTLTLAAWLFWALPGPGTTHAASLAPGATPDAVSVAAPSPNPLAQAVEARRQAGNSFKAVALFGAGRPLLQGAVSQEPVAQTATEAVSQGIVLPVNQQAMADLVRQGSPSIALRIPTRSRGTVELELYKEDVLAAGFRVLTSDGQRLSAPQSAHYRGIVKGDPQSRAAISIFENEVVGFFSSGDDYHVVGRLAGNNPAGMHIVYEHHDLKWEPPTAPCAMDDANTATHGTSFRSMLDSVLPQSVTPRCVQLYVETEYDIYQSLGSVSAVTNYVSAVYNQVNVLYANNQTPMSALSQVYVWTSPDPYNTMSENRLYDFTGYRRSFTGTFGTLWTFENIRSMAYDINTYCQPSAAYRSAFCGLWGGSYSNVPTYSWTVYIIAHELGHLFGSEHTHACVWNGNNTAIDGCSGYVEYGTCALPSNPACGSLMSYCTYCIDFNEGFGAQPGEKIRTRYAAATCVPTCDSTTCNYTLNPTSASFTAASGTASVTVTTATGCTWTAVSNVSWITVTSGASGTGSGAVQYQVAANPGTTARTGTMTVAGSTFTVSQAGTDSSTCTTYTGSLYGAGDYQYQPNGNWYYSATSGTHTGTLTGPAGTNFDMELYKSNATGWTLVASSNGLTSNETVSYNGTAGYYYWQIISRSGSGDYSFCLAKP